MSLLYMYLQTWSRLVLDYQCLNRHLEAVEGRMPAVPLLEETEERLTERIALYQVYQHKLFSSSHIQVKAVFYVHEGYFYNLALFMAW